MLTLRTLLYLSAAAFVCGQSEGPTGGPATSGGPGVEATESGLQSTSGQQGTQGPMLGYSSPSPDEGTTGISRSEGPDVGEMTTGEGDGGMDGDARTTMASTGEYGTDGDNEFTTGDGQQTMEITDDPGNESSVKPASGFTTGNPDVSGTGSTDSFSGVNVGGVSEAPQATEKTAGPPPDAKPLKGSCGKMAASLALVFVLLALV